MKKIVFASETPSQFLFNGKKATQSQVENFCKAVGMEATKLQAMSVLCYRKIIKEFEVENTCKNMDVDVANNDNVEDELDEDEDDHNMEDE